MEDYLCWYAYGELFVPNESSNPYRNMVMDAMRMSEGNVRECPIVEEEPNTDAARFFDLLKDSDEPLWDSCTNHRKLKNCATITDGFTDGLAPVDISQRVERKLWNCATITDGLRTSRSTRMLEAWSVGTFTDGLFVTFTNGITVGTFTHRNYQRIEKSGRIFEIFWCEYKFITDENYRWKLMPPTIINGPSVISSEKLLYKTPPSPSWFIFSLGSSSPFFFSSSFVFSFWKRFYCFGGSFKHIKRYVFFFPYLCIFLF
jgi:hypothetical protein